MSFEEKQSFGMSFLEKQSFGMSFEEKQPWGKTIYDVIEGSQISFNTKRAHITLLTNPHFGRMLFIDGVLQSAESDEKIYHKKLASLVPDCVKRVLVIGGAEGAVLRELFLLPLEEVVMVDWDEELVSHMRLQETFSNGAFEDSRLTLLFEDCSDYFDKSEEFDCIILDLLDANSDEEVEWLFDALLRCFKILRKGRIILNAGGNPEKILTLLKQRTCFFPEVHTIFVPSFQEIWHLITIDN